jgi:DNA repair exonuclease SbcCD ATPase subunit
MSTIYYFNSFVTIRSFITTRFSNVKKGFILSLLGLLFFGLAASAQMVNKDSFSLVSKINNDKEKLAKLQSTVAEKTKEKKQTAVQAQESADDNRRAANHLSDDPQDKKLARKADNEAYDARSDARKARKATDRLEELEKDIRNLKEKIAKEESKLNGYVMGYKAGMNAAAGPMPKDSVH